MAKYIQSCLLPIVAALTLAAAPAQAITITTAGAGAGSGIAAPTQTLSKKELKRQRKLAKKCAKLAAGKIRKASKRAQLEPLCRTAPIPPTPSVTPTLPPVDGPTTPSSTDAGGGTIIPPPPGVADDGLDEIIDLPPTFETPDVPNSWSGDTRPAVPTRPHLPPDAVVPQPTAVPEPGSLALLALGLLGLGLARRRSQP